MTSIDHADEQRHNKTEFGSCFLHWDESSAVRSKPRNYDCHASATGSRKSETDSWFFPAALPFLEHPLLAGLKQQQIQELLARNLISFLEYTTLLEHRIVNRSAESIAHNHLSVPIPQSLRMDALRLYTDEAYHAVISADVSNQVADIFDIQLGTRRFQRISRIEALANTFQYRELGWFLIGFVSETVITKQFLKVGKTTIAKPVYSMLMDHLEDERKHSRYFIKLFFYIWSRISEDEREFCAAQLPRIIQECFRLDSEILQNDLISIGLSAEASETIAAERNTEEENRRRARAGASATLHTLRKCNFFSNQRYASAFFESGLFKPGSIPS